MRKPDANEFPILDQLHDRWSPRAFSSRLVPLESVRSLIEAARWAASCFNAQPWRFILASRNEEAEFESALACLNEWNRSWAAPAPLLLFAVARLNFDDGAANRHALYDTGQAVAQLTQIGLRVKISGSGRVIGQVPEPGVPVKPGMVCLVECNRES